MKLKDQNVLITGGASGIGKLMGAMALEKGAKKLIIWDINQESIDKVVAEHSALGSVVGYRVDVSDNACVEAAYAKVKEECGDVDVLIQCAGIVTSNKTFNENSVSEIDRTMKINAIAPMYVAHAMLPDMIARNHGHICNISSAAGTLAMPKMSIYASSKWAVLGWSESVRIELDYMKSMVHFTTVCPYFINTGMFEGVKSWFFPILDPVKVSKRILKAIERNRDYLGIPFSFHFTRFAQGILPFKWVDFIFGEVFGIYHAMDNFTGRK